MTKRAYCSAKYEATKSENSHILVSNASYVNILKGLGDETSGSISGRPLGNSSDLAMVPLRMWHIIFSLPSSISRISQMDKLPALHQDTILIFGINELGISQALIHGSKQQLKQPQWKA
ncbi:hypothetical protein CHS0354_010295 [Potamilus streckersoni]|uniref:Uncharacterized protein n=1 Tax=Potamilus streckersoni TaxID=2493646 RepID=A0AAE0TCM9_9BIVA|nr:hypothetical protein CHS0354_010295 [Potamilus streckersoni]